MGQVSGKGSHALPPGRGCLCGLWCARLPARARARRTAQPARARAEAKFDCVKP